MSNPQGALVSGPRAVLFHHIPKTAGSTFRRMLEQLFEPSNICPAEVDNELPEEPSPLTETTLFAGHFSYDALSSLFTESVHLTFLRHPVQRVISEFDNVSSVERFPPRWLQRMSNDKAMQDRIRRVSSMTLVEYLECEDNDIVDLRTNRQTRYLVRSDSATEGASYDGYNHAAWFTQNPNIPSSADISAPYLLETAMENLRDRFAFVGIQEEFELSLSLFGMTFGMLPLSDTKRLSVNMNPLNPGGQSYRLPEAVHQRLLDENDLDLRLWNYGKQLLRERVSAFSRELQRENRPQARSISRPDTETTKAGAMFRIKAADLYAPRGFHRIVTDGLGRTFRWTGWEDYSYIELSCDMADCDAVQVRIQLLGAITPAALSGVAIELDSRPAEYVDRIERDGLTSLVFQAAYAPCHTHIIRVESPISLEPDTVEHQRWLGVAFHALELEPLKEALDR